MTEFIGPSSRILLSEAAFHLHIDKKMSFSSDLLTLTKLILPLFQKGSGGGPIAWTVFQI